MKRLSRDLGSSSESSEQWPGSEVLEKRELQSMRMYAICYGGAHYGCEPWPIQKRHESKLHHLRCLRRAGRQGWRVGIVEAREVLCLMRRQR